MRDEDRAGGEEGPLRVSRVNDDEIDRVVSLGCLSR